MDERNLRSPDSAQITFGQPQQVASAKQDLSSAPGVCRQQVQQRRCECALPATGLAENAHNLASMDLKIDSGQRMNLFLIRRMVGESQFSNLDKNFPGAIHGEVTPRSVSRMSAGPDNWLLRGRNESQEPWGRKARHAS